MAPSETACINSSKLCMVCMAQLFQQITWLFEIRCALLERNHVKFYLVFDLKERNQIWFDWNIFTFRWKNVGWILPSLCSWHAEKDIVYARILYRWIVHRWIMCHEIAQPIKELLIVLLKIPLRRLAGAFQKTTFCC